MAEKLNELTQKIIDLGIKLADNAEPTTKAAWDLTLWALRLDAIVSLFIAFLFVLFVCFALRSFHKHSHVFHEKETPENLITGLRVIIQGIVAALVSLGLAMFITKDLGATIITIISPEASLALKFLS